MTKLTGKTLLLGNNQVTSRIAERLLDTGTELTIATPQDHFDFSPDLDAAIKARERSARLFSDTSVLSCRGFWGDFNLRMLKNGESFPCRADQIIICEDLQRIAGFSDYGLSPSPFICSLTQAVKRFKEDAVKHDSSAKPQKVVFLMGLLNESHPVIALEVMQTALLMQQSGKQIYILTGNLKVAARGLEKLYRESRKAGVIYVKFTESRPDIQPIPNKNVIIEFKDEITDQPLRLSPDLTVVDEVFLPSDYLGNLIRVLEVDTDLNGFAQADNVHRLTVLTNRKGILVAGPARSILSNDDQRLDADNAVLSASALNRVPAESDLVYAEIDTGNCIRCLTCHRLCPYRAITVNTRVFVQPEACESCGICMAECPRGAIHLKGSAGSTIQKDINHMEASPPETPFIPSIAVFCCSRSAMPAGKLASCMGHPLPKGLKKIEIPCAGSVSMIHLLSAIQSGVDGVLVLTCHEGNCHSGKGNQMAVERVHCLKTMINNMGFETKRLMIKTLASNMGTAFAKIANEFEAQLLKLGHSRLKPRD